MQEKKALVVGLGLSGMAATDVLLHEGYFVLGVDAHLDKQAIEQWLQSVDRSKLMLDLDKVRQDLSEYELAIISPGIAQTHPLYKQIKDSGMMLMGEAEFALSRTHQKCIGITGSNGKTTLTLLLSHILCVAGYKAKALGNVGVPFSTYLFNRHPIEQEVLVCELSSFQLETLTAKKFDYVIILEISQNHLDRHSSFEEYASAKFNLLRCLKPEGVAFILEKTVTVFRKQIDSIGCKVKIIPQDSCLQLPQKREYCGLMDLVRKKALGIEVYYLIKEFSLAFSISEKVMMEALSSFTKPPHRLEFVKVVNGVYFVNDSKATTAEAVIHAVKTLQGKIVLIVGGKNKGLSFTSWKVGFESYVDKILAIGESGPFIADTLKGYYDVTVCETLDQAMEKAWEIATPESTILLSPGCASYDQYRDYMHRGEHFKEIVTALENRCVND